MFYILTLKRNIIVSAEELGPLFNRRLEGHLRKAVEGAEVQPHGLIIAVTDILDGDKITAKILDDGTVKAVVEYKAIVFRLNKHEVVDAIVDRVTPEGLYCEVGPSTVYIGREMISSPSQNNNNNGNQMMTMMMGNNGGGSSNNEFHYDATSALVARYVSRDGSKSIAPGKVVRCRILAEVIKEKDYAFRALATMAEPFLGVRD